MYSVLILNKITTKSFNEYYPLFLNAVKDQNVAVCRWHEAGGDAESLLPDLHKLTDDKREWRAIIVRTDNDIDTIRCSDENPYDFTNPETDTDTLSESEVPLIRLTHYLGGFPRPDVKFDAKREQKEGFSERTVYSPHRNKEEDELYEKLCEKYDFNGKKPDEIILITFMRRKKAKPDVFVKNAWKDYYEIQSSEFWKRNRYPSKCRFITFNSENEGPIRHDADLFEFWTAVSLIATNEISPSFLQAYRLYSVKVDISEEAMQKTMQSTVTHLIGARHYVERMIREDLEKRLAGRKTLPNYEVNVNVSIDAPSMDIGVNYKKFPVCPDSVISDNARWTSMKMKAFDGIDECIRYSEKALDESADIMRRSCDVPDDEILPLENYQKKQMEEELSGVYSDIIRIHSSLPKGSEHYQKKLAGKEDVIKENFVERVKTSPAGAIIGAFAVLALLALGPAIYLYVNEKSGNYWVMAIILVAMLAVFGLTELIVLVIQKLKTNSLIKDYNEDLRSSVGKLSENASLYSDFISKIATFTKGKQYLKKLSKKKFLFDDAYTMQQRHKKAINQFLMTIKKWCVAYDLKVSFDIGEEVSYEMDYDEKPQLNPLYTFHSIIEKEVPINRTGDFMVTPLEFVERFDLEREELYDEYKT